LSSRGSTFGDPFAIEVIDGVNSGLINQPFTFDTSDTETGFFSVGEHETVFTSHIATGYSGAAVEVGVLWGLPVAALLLGIVEHSNPSLLERLGASYCHDRGNSQLHHVGRLGWEN
jgi:hypothetical protein